MPKGQYLTTLLRSPRTVLTTQDISLLWHEPTTPAARVRLNYYVKLGQLVRLRHGIYAKSKDYNPLELGNRIITPSYVSFETVLLQSGLIFQFQKSITLASYLTRQIVLGNRIYQYSKIKDSVLTNTAGIDYNHESWVATPARAFLDTLYNRGNFHFDNLRPLNWTTVFELLPIYGNKLLIKRVQSLYEAL